MDTYEIMNQVSAVGEAVPVKGNFNLIFWILITINLVLIAISQALNPGYIKNLFSLAFNNRALVNNIREDLNFGKISSILLNLTYFNSLALIAWIAIKSEANLLIFALVGVFIAAALIKTAIIQLISFLASTKIGLQDHIISHLIYFQIGGIILTPILIFTRSLPDIYIESLLIGLIIIVAILIIARESQSLMRALQYKISIFYIILYLCTLELLPLVVGIRVFILNNGVLI